MYGDSMRMCPQKINRAIGGIACHRANAACRMVMPCVSALVAAAGEKCMAKRAAAIRRQSARANIPATAAKAPRWRALLPGELVSINSTKNRRLFRRGDMICI